MKKRGGRGEVIGQAPHWILVICGAGWYSFISNMATKKVIINRYSQMKFVKGLKFTSSSLSTIRHKFVTSSFDQSQNLSLAYALYFPCSWSSTSRVSSWLTLTCITSYIHLLIKCKLRCTWLCHWVTQLVSSLPMEPWSLCFLGLCYTITDIV